MIPEDIDRAEAILLDALALAGVLLPPPTGPAMVMAKPVLTAIIKHYMASLKAGLASGAIVPDGRGGLVTSAWARDPRHQLNPDGSFKY